jgi:DNA-binding NtrC family response regulator
MTIGTSTSPSATKDAILLVDDEAAILEMYREALGAHFDVTTASSVKEAEGLLNRHTYKVVVSDHLMPGGNGLSFLVRAREESPDMARVLVTGYMKPEMMLRAVNEAAVFRYLLKPVPIPELIEAVKDAVKSVAA